MKEINKRKLIFTILGTTLGVYLVFKYILPLVVPFILAYAIAAMILPFTRMMEKKCRIPRTIGGGFALIVLGGLLGLGLMYVAKNLIEQIQMLIKNMPIYQSYVMNSVDSLCMKCDKYFGLAGGQARAFVDNNINTMLMEIRTNIMPAMTEQTFQAALKLFGIIGTILFTFVSILLIVQDADEIKKGYKNQPFYSDIKMVTSKLSGAGIAYLKAQLIIMSIISVINVAGLLIVKNKYAFLAGIGIAVIDAFPVLGSGTILIPWAVIVFFTKDVFQAAVLLSLYLASQLIRQLLEPKLIGDKIGIKPIFTIMAMYAGVKLFGILGFILGPIALIIIKAVIGSINQYQNVRDEYTE